MTGILAILFENPLLFVTILIALLFSVTIHEFSHAYAANKLGDPTAKNLGRLSLNPLVHLDPLGTLTLMIAGFGWGKAVPVNYYNLKNPKRDAAIISFAGPASNFVMAILLTVFIKLIDYFFGTDNLSRPAFWPLIMSTFIYPIVLYNLVLGIFNLLPIEPLDGFKIVNGCLPPRLSVQWIQLAPYGIFILIFMVATGSTSRIILPIVSFLISLLKI